MVKTVLVSKRAEKSLFSLAKGNHVAVAKFFLWKREVETLGLEHVKKLPGYHDEALKGKILGLRSIRLTGAYRAYYRIVMNEIEFLLVEEVNKHDYKKIERLFGG